MSKRNSYNEIGPDESVQSELDFGKLESFVGRVVGDFGSAMGITLAYIGDKLGLYKAMAEAGPVSSEELAKLSGTSERYVREWLINQAAGGYIDYDTATGKYNISPENAAALTDEESPFFVSGGFQVLTSMLKAEERITESFKTGKGMLWGEHHHGLFEGTERFFRPGYNTNLVQNWLPAMEGVIDKLKAGAIVADIGCGHGASTLIMAKAFPNSHFYGYDNHGPSIDRARKLAGEMDLSDNAKFDVFGADNYPGNGYDLVCYFDCLHDMGEPVRSMAHTAKVLDKNGTVMIVEPMAGRKVEENFNPVGRVYSGASVMCCTPNAIASGSIALGTVASDDALMEVAKNAGFKKFRRATETPFNRVFEARL